MNNNVTVLATDKKAKIKEAVKYGVATAITASVMHSASAAEITKVGEGLSAEIEGVKTLVLALFTAGGILLGLFAGFRYLKKGANSA